MHQKIVMYLLRRTKRQLVFLFVCGFFLGVLLEIIIIENKFNLWQEQWGNKNKLTCLILLKHNHMRYIKASKETWLKECDEYRVIKINRADKSLKRLKGMLNHVKNWETCSTKIDCNRELNDQNLINVVGESGWSGLCKAFQFIKVFSSEWIIIVPDNLMVLTENLKTFIQTLNPKEEYHYYGHAVKNYEADYNVISAGILISWGVFIKLMDKFSTEVDCSKAGKYWENEDFFLGKYLQEIKIFPKDTRDVDGKGKFHGYNLNNLFWPGKLFLQSTYYSKALYPIPKGFNCCSSLSITIDATSPDGMRNLHYFLSKMRMGTITSKSLHREQNNSFVWKDFLRDEGYKESEIESMSQELYQKIWEKKIPIETLYNEMRNFIKNHDENT